MTAEQLYLVFCVYPHTCPKTWNCRSVYRARMTKKNHFIANRKAVCRIYSVKMQADTIDLWACVHSTCVRVSGIESLYWLDDYLWIHLFVFLLILWQDRFQLSVLNSKQRSQCPSYFFLNFSCIWKLHLTDCLFLANF